MEVLKFMNALIAYYSRAGENYCNGDIVALEEGNTEIVAKKIAILTGESYLASDRYILIPVIIIFVLKRVRRIRQKIQGLSWWIVLKA